MRIPVIATITVLLGLSGCAAGDPEAELRDRAPIDRAIENTVSEGAFPFLYVRVESLDGDIVYEHSVMNPEFGQSSPTGQSWMRLWSMSKSVTIATVLDLEEEGVLSRSDLVTDYIPEFSNLRVLDPSARPTACEDGLSPPQRAMTIEDLLNHNDGFYYPFTGFECLDNAMNSARLPEAASSDELIERIGALPLHPSDVGAHQYGIGTTVLGLVAERATGLSFDAVVEARVTGPLGISDTLAYALPPGAETYPPVTGADGQLRVARDGELDIFGGPVPEYGQSTNIYLGGEGMVGTPRAYAAFLRMLANSGELNGVRILEPSTVEDWSSPKTQLDSAYGHNGFNIWVTSGRFDGLPDQKPGLLVGGGYEGTAFWIDVEAGYVGLIMSQVHAAPTNGVDEVARIRGLLYQHWLEPGITY